VRGVLERAYRAYHGWASDLHIEVMRRQLAREEEIDREAARARAEAEQRRQAEPREERCRCGYVVLVGEDECPRCHEPIDDGEGAGP
jgi:hypothetical protein